MCDFYSNSFKFSADNKNYKHLQYLSACGTTLKEIVSKALTKVIMALLLLTLSMIVSVQMISGTLT